MQNKCVYCGSKNIEVQNFYTGKFENTYIDIEHDQIKIVYCEDCDSDEYLGKTIKFLRKQIRKIKNVMG